MITLYASGESPGDAEKNFDGDWQDVYRRANGVKGNAPEVEPVGKKDGWNVSLRRWAAV